MPKITYKIFVRMEEDGELIPWGSNLVNKEPVELMHLFASVATSDNFNFITAECFRYEDGEEKERQWCIIID